MSEQTPFEKTAETGNKLAGSLALQKALEELATAEGETDTSELAIQKEILIQALLAFSPIIGEA